MFAAMQFKNFQQFKRKYFIKICEHVYRKNNFSTKKKQCDLQTS